jgi:hypothetical protein
MVDRGLGRRRELLALIRRDAGVLARSGMGWAEGLGAMLRAGVELHAGSREQALAQLGRAAAKFEGADASGYAAAVRDRLARLKGGASSAAEIERSAEFFRAQNVACPERFIEMLAPGFHVACGANRP